MRRIIVRAVALVAVLAASGCGVLVRSSVSDSGGDGDGASIGVVSASSFARYVAFESDATNLVPGGTPPGVRHVFVRDHTAKSTRVVDVASGGAIANGPSRHPSISRDGRYVAFESDATNLGAGSAGTQVYVRDLTLGTTTIVSRTAGGAPGNGDSRAPSIKIDEPKYVAYESDASDLVAGDTNSTTDIFSTDWTASTTTRVSLDLGGTEANGRSLHPAYCSGIFVSYRIVLFASDATNLATSVLGANPTPNGLRQVYAGSTSPTGSATISRTVAAAGDGTSDHPACSTASGVLAFESDAGNLVAGGNPGIRDVLKTSFAFVPERVSALSNGVAADADSSRPSVSSDGSVAFTSDATNLPLATGASTVYVSDGASTSLLGQSLAFPGVGSTIADGPSDFPSLSPEGHYVAFASNATNLVGDDANGLSDVFVSQPFTVAGLPGVTAVDPSSLSRPTSPYLVLIGITGRGFSPDAAVTLGPGITVNSVTWVSATLLSVEAVVLPTVATGVHEVRVTNPIGDVAACNCLTVTP